MKKIIYGFVLLCMVFGISLIDSCKKDPIVPVLTTSTVIDITINSVTIGGIITKNGGADIIAGGVCWGTSRNPTISGSRTTDGTSSGSFKSKITGLTPNTLYYVRAYATNIAGTAYGNEVSFTTSPIIVATLTTSAVTSITLTTSVSGGNITTDGGGTITSRGVCWATTSIPTTINDKTTNGTGNGSFTSNLSGLQPGTIYYVRAYATNSAGTTYGNEVSFTTIPIVVPTLTTNAVTSVSLTSAVSGGSISADGGGAITIRGVCWNTVPDPTTSNSKTTDGTGTDSFVSNLTNLQRGTTYYIKAYATNSAGTAYGDELSFITDADFPTVNTTQVSAIKISTATSGGNITADGGGTITLRGVCWATTPNPTKINNKTTDGTGTGAFTSNLSGLTAGTTYYLRAYGTNSAGTTYGNQYSFNTNNPVFDVDGNSYNTVTIGTQVWMAEDLKTTRYSDDMSIPNVTDAAIWPGLTTPAYCWYDNNIIYKNTYGALYNWFTISTMKLCPTGWHVPTDLEFNTLELYLGMPPAQVDSWGWRGTDQGGQMKNNTGWAVGENGTNTSGFSALPGGYIYGGNGAFYALDILTYWWSSTVDASDPLQDRAWYRRLDGSNLDASDNYIPGSNNSTIYKASTLKHGGKFVRCVKN